MSQQQPPGGYGPPSGGYGPSGYGPPPSHGNGPQGYPPQGYGPPQGYPQQLPAKSPWYHSGLIVGLSLIVCWPAGVVMLWVSPKVSMGAKIAGTVIFGGLTMLALIGMAGGGSKSRSSTTTRTAAERSPGVA